MHFALATCSKAQTAPVSFANLDNRQPTSNKQHATDNHGRMRGYMKNSRGVSRKKRCGGSAAHHGYSGGGHSSPGVTLPSPFVSVGGGKIFGSRASTRNRKDFPKRATNMVSYLGFNILDGRWSMILQERGLFNCSNLGGLGGARHGRKAYVQTYGCTSVSHIY